MAARDPYRRFETSSGRRIGAPGFSLVLTAVLAALFWVFGPLVVGVYWIPTGSMVPTLRPGDEVLANEVVYRFEPPKRGQIVIFRNPEDPGGAPLIKRIVGLPGDTIQIRRGVLYVDGAPRREPYVNRGEPEPFGPVTVPPGRVFVLGDNRTDSEDSRYFGAVSERDLEGEVFLVFWPPGHFGWL